MDKAGFWNHNGKGQKINMYNYMNAAGTSVPDIIFKNYYNNTVDSQLAGVFGIDLGFEKNNAVPEILSEKYSSLVTEHLQNTSTPASLKDKYKFTIYSNEGIGTELFNIDENNPFLDQLLGQHDFAGINNVIDNSGCNFMAIGAYSQLLTGIIFSKNDILSLFADASVEGFVNSNNAFVNDRNSLSDLFFKKMNWKGIIKVQY